MKIFCHSSNSALHVDGNKPTIGGAKRVKRGWGVRHFRRKFNQGWVINERLIFWRVDEIPFNLANN